MFETIEDVPTGISEYYGVDEDGVVVLKSFGETKVLEDLIRLVEAGKPQHVIDKFTQYILNNEHKVFHEAFLEYLVVLEEVTEYNENLPVVGEDEDGDPIYADPKEIPVPPVGPPETTVAEFQADNAELFGTYNKSVGADINGVMVSLTEENQNGIASVLKGVELATKYSQNIYPLNFKASTQDGTESIIFNTQGEFEMFALQFMAARQAFFR